MRKMSVYAREDRIKAVELWLKYEKSAAAVISAKRTNYEPPARSIRATGAQDKSHLTHCTEPQY